MATSGAGYQNDEPSSPTFAPWERFSRWLHCVCIVVFDLELGQAIEVWTACCLTAIAMLLG